MKRILIFFFLGCNILLKAQSNYSVSAKSEDKLQQRLKIEAQKRESFGDCIYINTYNFKEGDRFIFEDFSDKSYISDFSELDFHFFKLTGKKNNIPKQLLAKEYSSRIVHIVNIEEPKDSFKDRIVTFMVEGTNDYIYLKTYSTKFINEHDKNNYHRGETYTFPDLIYLADIDAFKTKYLGAEFYTKFKAEGKKYSKVKVINVGAGSENSPIKVVYENESGKEGEIEFCTCGSNLTYDNIESNYFDNHFLLKNPKDQYKGSQKFWDLIQKSLIDIGMSEDDLYLSLGKPDDINETATSGLIITQYVYPHLFVYISKGVITSYQTY